MTKKLSVTEKIVNKVKKEVGPETYLALINKVSDKEALALAVSALDKSVLKGGFHAWRLDGYSHSKRASRVMRQMLPQINTIEADMVMKAKKSYIYSVCEKQNDASTNAYKSVRKAFLEQVDNFLSA
jgi:hypothetical protein